jgi:hypothetical protein
MAQDSFPIQDQSRSEQEPSATNAACASSPGLGALAGLFILFLLVTSDGFVDSVIGLFQGGTVARTPTAYGTVLQGIFLVVLYALGHLLLDKGII